LRTDDKSCQLRNDNFASSRHVITCASVVAFALKLYLALTTYGNSDMWYWEAFAAKIHQSGALALYRDGIQLFRDGAFYHSMIFNHPPFMTRVLPAWDWLATVSHAPLRFWLRLASSLADVGSVVLVWKLLARYREQTLRPLGLALVALSPVSIMVSGFHGNTDPIMIFFILLSIYLIENRGMALLAGIAFGMATNVKIVPVIFAPAILFYIPSLGRRAQFAMAAIVTFTAASMPYLAMEPALLWHRVFNYNAMPGFWGLSLMAQSVEKHLPALSPITGVYLNHPGVAKWLALTAVVAAGFWMNRHTEKPPLFSQCGINAFLFLFLISGFGVHYLAWLVPWGAAMIGASMAAY